jgi:hypothetical protein
MAYAFEPYLYLPPSAGPLTPPFGPGPIGPLTLYSPPGLAPVYGPLGPAGSVSTLVPQAFPNGLPLGATGLASLSNTLNGLGLAGLQLAEMGNLYGREGLGPAFQAAAGTWVVNFSTQASATYTILRGMCHGAQHRATAAGAGR